MTNDTDSTFQDLASAVQEIDRINHELGAAKERGDAWESVLEGYGIEPERVLDKIKRLEAENAQLAAALADAELHAQTSYTTAAVCCAELRRIFDDHFNTPDCRCRECYNRIKDVLDTVEGEATSVLRDLLAPFLGSVEKLHSYDGKDGWREWVSRGDWLYPGQCLAIVGEVELARLQAVMERKA